MAKYFLSILLAFVVSAGCRAAANDVSDEFNRLRNVSNKALLERGYKYIVQCKYDSSMIYYSMVVNRYYENNYSKRDLPDIVKAMQNLGIIYMTFSYDYKKSYDYLLQARELAEQSKCYENLPNIYNCIANILQLSNEVNNSNDGTEVMNMLRKAFRLSLKMGDRNTLALAMNNLVIISFGKQGNIYNIGKEIRLFRKACKRPKDLKLTQTLLMCSAYEAYGAGKSKEAVEYLEKSMTGSPDNPLDYRGILSSQGLITKIYLDRREYDRAIASISRALDIALKNDSWDFSTMLYRDMMDAYRAKGDSAMAVKYELKYLRSNEKLLDEGQLSSVKNVKFMRELNKANEQVRLLSERRRTQDIMLCAACVVLVVIIVLLYRLYRANRKIKQNYKYLYRSNVELLAKEAEVRRQRSEAVSRIGELEQKVKSLSYAPSAAEQPKADADQPKMADVQPKTADAQPKQKYQNSSMSDESLRELYSAVLGVMENSEEIYKLGFNVDRLSELVHSHPRYVSQAINCMYGSNFNSLICEYRIKEACRRLSGNPAYANMTIEGIAESVGFKSRTNFGKLFKNITGLSPSAYQRIAREGQR